MYLIFKLNFDVNNIKINNKNNTYNIIYDINNIIISGITIKIISYKVIINNNLQYIYINDKNIIEKLLEIEEYINSKIDNFVLLRKYNNEFFIITKLPLLNSTNSTNIHTIHFNKITFQINKYIPIIYIL